MRYVGLHTQISRNNFRSVMLLIAFPVIILASVWVFLLLLVGLPAWLEGYAFEFDDVNYFFVQVAPWVVGIVLIWFLIAYFWNASIIKSATGARPLERRENPRVYNITENLCMSCGMNMPKLYVVDDPQLNAYASGINEKSYAVTVTTGLLDTLDDRELAGVIGHELTHIRNRDTRLLITSIVFVGILSTMMVLTWRLAWIILRSSGSRRGKDKGGGAGFALILMLLSAVLSVGYFFTLITRFAVSRKREFMADAGGSELCGDPLALSSALRKISGNPGLANCDREDVAQLFIHRPKKIQSKLKSFFSGMFATHPDINKRIAILEQF